MLRPNFRGMSNAELRRHITEDGTFKELGRRFSLCYLHCKQ
jgi:hypothetical protein